MTCHLSESKFECGLKQILMSWLKFKLSSPFHLMKGFNKLTCYEFFFFSSML